MAASFLAILGWTLFAVALLLGIALNLIGLFGNWVILAAVVIAYVATGFEHFTLTGIAIMAGLAALGEVLEFVAAAFGASRFGGSKGASVAALVGCLLGAVAGSPLLPVIGTLIGACAGAFAGATLYEYIKMERPPKEAFVTGVGAALGKVGGILAKFMMGLAILSVAWLTF
jgi:hypothetical protein